MFLSLLILLSGIITGPSITAQYPDFKIVINIPATELALYENGEVLQKFKIAVGQKKYPTPIGIDSIKEIVWNPWWYPPDSEWAEDKEDTPPGPGNPLGPVKLMMSGDLRLHGTDQDASIGNPASHACLRMHNRDVKKLAWILQSRLSSQFDEGLLKKYAKNSEESFHVSLGREVPVELIYDPIEITKEKIILYADIYSKITDKKEALLNKLSANGMDPEQVDPVQLESLLKKWNKGKTIQIERERLLNQK